MRRKRKSTIKDHSPSAAPARTAAPRNQGSPARHKAANASVDTAPRSSAPAPVKPEVREPPAPVPVKPEIREPPAPAPVKPEIREPPVPATAPAKAAVSQAMSAAPPIRAKKRKEAKRPNKNIK